MVQTRWWCLLSAKLLIFAFFAMAVAAGAERFVVRVWESEDGLPSNNVRSVVQATDGYLWVATAEGVVRFDGARFTTVSQEPPRAVYALENGEVWIAAARGGLWRWSGGGMTAVWEDVEEELQEARVVKNIRCDDAGSVFIERADGVYEAQHGGALQKVALLPAGLKKGASNSVHGNPGDRLEINDVRGWRWTTESGSLAVVEQGMPPQVLPEFSDGKRVAALLEDREGNVWVATNGSGLFQIRQRRVEVIDTAQGLTDLKVRALLEDRSGALWAANRNGGLDRIQSGSVESFDLNDGGKLRMVAAMCEDREGALWVVKENGGVFRHSGGSFEEMSKTGPWGRRASAMVADASGAIWLGDADGLLRCSGGSLKRFGVEHGLPAQPVTTLAVDAEQRLWFGTARGLVYQGRDSFIKVGDTGGAAVSTLLPDKNGAVWAATLGGGLFLFQKGSQTRFKAPEPRLTSVIEDDSGHLWLGSLAGIFRVSKADLLEVGAEAPWLHLDRADGMVSRECTGGFQPAGWRGRDGRLFFPTVHGIATIRSQELDLNEVRPLVQIEEPRQRLVTGPGRSRLEFRFTALSFTVPEKVRFRTRLEGLQTDWQETGALRNVAYEAVPPGDYVFRVMAANNDGVWSETAATLAVRVRPHFWETLWFQGTAVALVIGGAFGVGLVISRARARGRMLRLEAQTARLIERERIAQDLHDDLGASLTEISLIAGLAAEDANAAKIPVIAVKAQQLVSTLDEIVWAVNPRHDTLASFTEYLSASAAELLDAAGIALRLEIAENLPEVTLDSVQRHALFLAAREALNNAVKHSGASEVRLGIHFNADGLVITIRDNGQGIAAEDSPLSEGLRNMQARLAGIGGTCQIESDAGGTVVVFSLGLRHKA